MATVVLSEAEKVYVMHGVQDDLRIDGRGCEDYRHTEIETDVVSNTSGSARVKIGHTDILVGVKAEMGTPKLERPYEGFLEFFVDCSANATPEFEGRGGEDLGTEIANTLYRLLECGGNLFDAISLAVKAALHNTRIPKVRVLEDDEGAKEIELSDDPYDCIRLNVENVPCIVTLSKGRTVAFLPIASDTMELRAIPLVLLVLCLLQMTHEQVARNKPRKNGAAKKAMVTLSMIEDIKDQIAQIINEVNVLKEKQALQTVCLRGLKVYRKCFLLMDGQKNFHEASDDCIMHGGILGVPHNYHENNELYNYAKTTLGDDHNIWVGITDIATEGDWVDVSGKATNYTNWETIRRQPDGGTKANCVAMSGPANGRWFDDSCVLQKNYYCQFNIL
ncbi:hypothetical protein chiPu_0008015 [Chiloscyllium punctatum]|uniref:Ribosomal RNA-processing protein 42 n=1 Tax=Chiloscyllium punctatum TaxID=137246 RepID=A0A401SGN3_CHIPU|nr:hypothetical protein [Chiloscyllium punctatum]